MTAQKYLSLREAAAYTGLPLGFFTNQVKHGSGPAYTTTTPRGAKFFSTPDLDAWVATWVKIPPCNKSR